MRKRHFTEELQLNVQQGSGNKVDGKKRSERKISLQI